ncbi:DUF7948 domain-containing protein [Fulvivirga sediminis]|uniref:Gliding motility-associated C-terminal domain-containing protein n=1 Tax=Fulvivirga sediminis TaxID=2803949 RepID=A0A937K2K9_9BACT|nr:PKD domain-containing protein [Fulvivirga sediminis]MBL3658706.1 gliding motility-associated C-terminal domain-containing protein [Fulvivirga sediminis]
MAINLSVTARDKPGIRFVENKGQFLKKSLYGADISNGRAYFGKSGFSYVFWDGEAFHKRHAGYEDENYKSAGFSEEDNGHDHVKMHVVNVTFKNAHTENVEAKHPYSTHYNYYYGTDSRKWVTKAKSFQSLFYNNIYDQTDMELYSQGSYLKYDLIIKPGGDPNAIKLVYSGMDDIYLQQGSLILETTVSKIEEYKPYAYQEVDGLKQQVVCEYVLEGNTLSFDFPLGYDESKELIIDPILIFSTYSGSNADNWGTTATYGENGKLYSGGITHHYRNDRYMGEFPATPGAFQTAWGGNWDIAILKYDSIGSNLEYATYLGGSGSEVPQSLIINSHDELVIFGSTNSTDFPITSNAYQNTFQGGSPLYTIMGEEFSDGSDVFVAKLSKDGSRLMGSTYFGGDGNDGIMRGLNPLALNYGDSQRGEVYVDDSDNIFIGGVTSSTDLFSSVTTFNDSYGGGEVDGFVAKFNADLSGLVWGGYLGGSGSDATYSLKVNDQAVYAAGGTISADFIIKGDGFVKTSFGDVDGWVARINLAGDLLLTTTYLGTSDYDQVFMLDFDSRGDIYVLGQTRGMYTITPGKYANGGGGQFIHKLSADLSTSIFSTMFGTPGRFTPNISPTAFLVNDCNNLYVAGWANTSIPSQVEDNTSISNNLTLTVSGLPTTADAYRQSTSGSDFYLMSLDADASSLLFATYFGGSASAVHVDGGTSRFDKKGIVYQSVCASCYGGSSFDVTAGAWSVVNGANSGCNNAAFKYDLASLRAVVQTNSLELNTPGITEVCMPDPIVFENLSIGGEIYEWNFGDGQQLSVTNTEPIPHYYKNPGKYRVTLKAIDPTTCIGEDVMTVEVKVHQSNLKVGEGGDICSYNSFKLTAEGGVSYHWSTKNGSFKSNEASPVVSPNDTTTYWVDMIDSNGCTKSEKVTVNVIPALDISFSAEKIYDCFSRPSLRLKNTSTNGNGFIWSMGDDTQLKGDQVDYYYEKDGEYTVRLSAMNEFCIYEASDSYSFYEIKVPNVITPGLEMDNDYFEILPESVVKSLQIYNRWGKLVYETDDYKNDWQANGLVSGVYYYEASIDHEYRCVGWVHVIK